MDSGADVEYTKTNSIPGYLRLTMTQRGDSDSNSDTDSDTSDSGDDSSQDSGQSDSETDSDDSLDPVRQWYIFYADDNAPCSHKQRVKFKCARDLVKIRFISPRRRSSFSEDDEDSDFNEEEGGVDSKTQASATNHYGSEHKCVEGPSGLKTVDHSEKKPFKRITADRQKKRKIAQNKTTNQKGSTNVSKSARAAKRADKLIMAARNSQVPRRIISEQHTRNKGRSPEKKTNISSNCQSSDKQIIVRHSILKTSQNDGMDKCDRLQKRTAFDLSHQSTTDANGFIFPKDKFQFSALRKVTEEADDADVNRDDFLCSDSNSWRTKNKSPLSERNSISISQMWDIAGDNSNYHATDSVTTT